VGDVFIETEIDVGAVAVVNDVGDAVDVGIVLDDGAGAGALAPEAAATVLSLVVSINVTTGGVAAANLPHCSKKARLSALCLSSLPSSSTDHPPSPEGFNLGHVGPVGEVRDRARR
jgi:hypothetical protein